MSQRRFGARALPWTAACVVAAFGMRGEADAQECISAAAKSALSDCPAGTTKASVTKKPDARFSAPPVGRSTPKTENKPTNPTDIAVAGQRDERQALRKKKSIQLLITEIQGLETLFGDTKKSAPDRPKLARRLAEGYVELEAAAIRDVTEQEVNAEAARKKKDTDGAKAATEAAAKAKQTVLTARKFAIKYYTLLKDTYPKWCLSPNAQDPSKSTGCGDEVLYYLAYEYEQAKDFENARKIYFELVENWKSSKYRPNAYLAFGELYFQEAQGDPAKWQAAELAYSQVTGSPPPENRVYGYALYKLGYVYWNQGEHEKSVTAFKQVIEYGIKHAQLPNATQLAGSARRDVIPVYALWGDPKKAFSFLKPLSGDSGQENEKTFAMMDELGLNYLDTGHYEQAIALYTDLMTRDKGAKTCEYHGHIADATLATRSGDKGAVVKIIEKQLAVHKEFLGGSADENAKNKCGNLTAELAAETAMAWHLEVVGTGGVRGTGDAKTAEAAADLYEQVVKTFTAADFKTFKFPRILEEDWPTISKIRYSMADLLYFHKDWKRCGPAFDAVVAEDPKGPDARAAAFAAALCYQNMYAEAHQNGEDRQGTGTLRDSQRASNATDKEKWKPKDFTDGQKGMLTAFNRYVCVVMPDKSNKEASDQLVEMKFARARTYFEARHWEESALGFRDVAMNHADHEVGVFAAQLYLESLNILGTQSDPAKPSCYQEMGTDTKELTKLYCDGAKASANAESCETFRGVDRDLGRKKAEALTAEAQKGGVGAREKFREAAQLYLDLWEQYGKEPCQQGKREACGRNDEVLYNAAQSFQAARLVAKAIAVRKMLIKPENNLHETALARKAVYEIGQNYQAIAVYEEAAAFYEKFAAESPKDEKAPRALSDAVVLRLGLGQQDQAIADSDLFQKLFVNRSGEAAQIAFAVGAHYAEREDWKAAEKRLRGAITSIDKNATLDLQIQAHGLLAHVFNRSGNKASAKTEYDKVRALWKDPDAAVRRIEEISTAAGEGDAQKVRRLAKSLEAVGEAYFFAAEEKKAIVDKIAFPEYSGSGDRAEVERFVATKVKDWQEKKRKAVEDADTEYQKVLGLQPVAPPRWVIASGARVGQMKGKFVAEFRAAPIPKEWTQNGPSPYGDLLWEEIRGAYYGELDRVSEPDRQAAKAANKGCLDLSVRHQYFDDFSRSCEQWLSKHFPSEYHLIDEFRGAPKRVGTGMSERAVPVNMDGSAKVAAE